MGFPGAAGIYFSFLRFEGVVLSFQADVFLLESMANS